MISLRPRLVVITSVLLVGTLLPSYAQKENQLISKFRAALLRGAEDIPEPALIMKGRIIMGNVPFEGAIYYHKPNNRMELTLQGMTFIAFQNDTIHWSYDPIADAHTVMSRSKEEAEAETARELRFDFASKDLLLYRERGHKLAYSGVIKMDSLEVHALTLTTKEGSVREFYLDAQTYLIYKIVAEDGYRIWANYAQHGEYVYPAYMLSEGRDGEVMEMVTTEIHVDASIPDSLFTVPQVAIDGSRKRQTHIDRLLTRGDSLYDVRDYAGAQDAYLEVLDHDQNNYRAYNGMGLSKVRQEKYYEAISDFNIALGIDPAGSLAMNNRGLAKFYLGDNNGAIDDYSSAIELDSSFVNAYKNRGLIYFRSKKYDEAADDFSSALAWAPDDGELHFRFAVAIAQAERYDEAILSYKKALALNYRTAQVYNYKGVSHYKGRQYDSAAVCFKTALELEPDHLQYLENYGNTLYKLEDYNSARKQFELYRALKDDNAEIHNLIGLCKFYDEDYHGAIADFTRGIDINPKAAVYFDNRAAAKERIEDYEGAISDYSRSIALYPNDPEVFYKRGLIKIHTSRKMEGCMDLGTANEMEYEPAREAIMKNCGQ